MRIKEFIIEKILFLSAFLSILIVVGMALVIFTESLVFWKEISLKDFFFGREWTPLFAERRVGILPLISGTFLITFIAFFVGVPSGFFIAVFLSEFCPRKVKRYLKNIVEILAGIPSIVYGYFALKFITPIIQKIFPETPTFNALSGGIVVGVMIIPIISSLCDDALSSVPLSLKEASYSLGAGKFETVFKVSLPYTTTSVFSAFLLGVGRAFGETMAVAIASGQMPKLTLNPLETIETLSTYIAQVGIGDIPHGTFEYSTIFAVALVLFIISIIINSISFLVGGKVYK